jgi:hypothetical protein
MRALYIVLITVIINKRANPIPVGIAIKLKKSVIPARGRQVLKTLKHKIINLMGNDTYRRGCSSVAVKLNLKIPSPMGVLASL